MLFDADSVAEHDGGGPGALAEDAVWLQQSTVGIAGTERLAKLADELGVTFVDAPVLGTKKPAEDGALVVLASGPEHARDAGRAGARRHREPDASGSARRAPGRA